MNGEGEKVMDGWMDVPEGEEAIEQRMYPWEVEKGNERERERLMGRK